jgi:lysophospholipase L1-like esterase
MVSFYYDYLNKFRFSEERYKNLQKTITLLKKKGPVFLVRMPLHKDIMRIEEKLDPEFNFKMNILSNQYDVPYFDFNDQGSKWEFKDGLHLTVESAKSFSEELSKKILFNNLTEQSKNISQNPAQLD